MSFYPNFTATFTDVLLMHPRSDLDALIDSFFLLVADYDLCSSNPMCGHGQCLSQGGSYSCQCDAGYTGLTCLTNIDECSSSPCEHGTCTDFVNSYWCSCNAGYGGPQCEVSESTAG